MRRVATDDTVAVSAPISSLSEQDADEREEEGRGTPAAQENPGSLPHVLASSSRVSRRGQFDSIVFRPAAGPFSVSMTADPLTIRRVLASWFLGPDPLPGMLNPEAPAASLRSLEAQTIRMILRRTLRNRWPDDDRW